MFGLWPAQLPGFAFLAYATSRGRILIYRRLYLPTSRTGGRERCRRADIDDTAGFETKMAMAKSMVRRTIADMGPCQPCPAVRFPARTLPLPWESG
ncbi:hypothetical protein SUDANB9_07785 [Streptomyces sp. enrichment culture]